jgi:hypothetical protein
MANRLPSFAALCIFASGLILGGGCGRSTGVAHGAAPAGSAEQSPTPPATTPSVASAAGPARPDAPSGNAGSAPPLPGPELGPARQPQAQAILETAVRILERRGGVSARIHQQIDLFGKQLVGSGVYFQQRSGQQHLIRLELRIQAGDQQCSLLQVLSPPSSKGHYLWTHRKLPGEEKLSRIDVVRAAAALEKAGDLPGRGAEGMLQGLGGIPKLLRGLQAAFDFSSAQRGRFDGLPVWRLQGQWKPDRLAEILPDQKATIEAGEPADLSKLPERLPDHVVLMLGQEDLFPRRIEYRRRNAEKDGRREESRTLVTMELFDVKLDTPIDRTRFIYNPGNTAFTDETENFINSLGATP